MNTETPTTAAELLSEWKTLNALNENATTRSLFMAPHLVSHMAAIAARLDEMCEDAGISIVYGAIVMFRFGKCDSIEKDGYRSVWTDKATPTDVIALLQWLLIKNENGK